MIQFSPDIITRLDRAKQEEYYNTSQSEMIRQLVKLGLDQRERKKANIGEEKAPT